MAKTKALNYQGFLALQWQGRVRTLGVGAATITANLYQLQFYWPQSALF